MASMSRSHRLVYKTPGENFVVLHNASYTESVAFGGTEDLILTGGRVTFTYCLIPRISSSLFTDMSQR